MKKSLKSILIFVITTLMFGVASYATSVKKGDVNSDGDVDAIDTTIVVRYLAGYEVLNEKELDAADIDENGEVDAIDCTSVVRYLSGYELLEDEIYVSSTGNDETADGTKENPYKTLTKAFDISNSGKTIVLLSDIELDKPCELNEGKFVLDLNGHTIIKPYTDNYEVWYERNSI